MPVTDPEAVLRGDRLAVTRALTQIENSTPEGLQLLEALFPHTGKAHLIGVTGALPFGGYDIWNAFELSLLNPKGKPIVAVCRSGSRSGSACNMLRKNGFENVKNLRGGMMAWESANLPVKRK
mgnify:CR=1 FL=1